MTRAEKGETFFSEAYNCAQSVFCTFCEDYGIETKAAAAAAAGFGGGLGGSQLTCGAVTGAILVIGCRYFDEQDKRGSKALVYEQTKRFLREFAEKHDSTACRQLLGVDLSTEEGSKEARERNLFKTKCAGFVRDACVLLESIISD